MVAGLGWKKKRPGKSKHAWLLLDYLEGADPRPTWAPSSAAPTTSPAEWHLLVACAWDLLFLLGARCLPDLLLAHHRRLHGKKLAIGGTI